MGAALAQHIITMHTRGCAVLAGRREETGRKCNAIDRERKRGSVTAHRVYEDTRMSNHSMQYICKSTHLLEPDGSSLLAEALTAEVKAVLADKTSLVRAVAATQCIPSVCRTSRVYALRTLTTGESPYRTCGGERTKQRRGSFWRRRESVGRMDYGMQEVRTKR